MNFLQSSPIEARSNPIVYVSLIVALIAISIFLVINIIYKIRIAKKKRELNNPDRATTKNDINYIAKVLNLTLEEKEILWTISQKNNIKNLWLQLKNNEVIDSIFKSEFSKLTKEEDISTLFSIRNKIDFYSSINSAINSTKTLPEGLILTYILENDRYTCKIIANTEEGLVLSVPKDVLGNEIKPQTLTKIMLSFITANKLAYNLRTRIIRYQTRNESEVIVTHTSDIQILHRRNQKRIPFNPRCIFSAVQVITGGQGKSTTIDYKPLEKKHNGTMVDISSDGCCIQTELPIKIQQYIYIEVEIEKTKTDFLTGLIVESEYISSKNNYILHIQFVRISTETKNRIYSLVYDYIK